MTDKKKRRSHRKGERRPSLQCAGCGALDLADALVRIACGDEFGVVVDPRGRIPGEALYLHPAAECIEKLSDSGVAPPVELRRALEEFLDRSILAELSRVAASGQVVGGHDKLALSLREGKIRCVLFAHDAAAGTLGSLQRAAGEALPFHPVALDKVELGARVGQAPRAAVGFPSSRASAVLEKWLGQRWRLGGRAS